MAELVVLPVGPEPDWELRDKNAPNLQSIAESGVILQSLRRSRERWLTSSFVKFSARPRGKQPEVVPPPHTIVSLGSCNLHIGPLTFLDTTLYQVQFHQPVLGVESSGSLVPVGPTSNTTQTKHLTPAISSLEPPAVSIIPSPPALATAATAAAASDIPTAQLTLDPRFLAHIYQTAATNPQLRELLNVSITGCATAEQTQTLGLILHAMATGPYGAPPMSGMTASVHGVPSLPGVPLELVLEFRERPNERWLIPRNLTVCTQKALDGGRIEIVIRTALFIATNDDAVDDIDNTRKPQVVELRLRNASDGIWQFIERWTDQHKADENVRVLDKITAETPRQYLQHRLPTGPLLDALRNLNFPPVATRSLNPTDNPPAKRKPAIRKVQSTVLSNMGPPDALTTSRENLKTGFNSEVSVKTTAKAKGKQRTQEPTNDTPQPPPAKRRRASQKEYKRPAIIACQTCQNTDVPLLLGGQFCRECIEQGRIPPQAHLFAQRQGLVKQNAGPANDTQ